MKRFFESDSAVRVERLPTFPALFAKLEEALRDCPEAKCFEYDFANFDWERWLRCMGDSSTATDLFEGKFARYSFDNVFRYIHRVSHRARRRQGDLQEPAELGRQRPRRRVGPCGEAFRAVWGKRSSYRGVCISFD